MRKLKMKVFEEINNLLKENNYLYYSRVYNGNGATIFDKYVMRFTSTLKQKIDTSIQCTTFIMRQSDIYLIYEMSEFNNFINKSSCFRYNYKGSNYFVYYFFDSNFITRCISNGECVGLDITELVENSNMVKNIVMYPKRLKILSMIQ